MVTQNFFLIIGTLYTIFALTTITCSLIMIIIISYNWRSKCRSTANLLACHSSVTLLFYAVTIVIQVPFVFQSNPLYVDQMNTTFCKIRSFITTYAALVKSYSYLVMATSCFFTIILHKHKVLLSFRANWIIIITSWIFSGIITIGTYLQPLAYTYELESGLCFLTLKYFATSFTVVTLVFVITVSTMIILYGIIMCHITRYSRNHPNSGHTLQAKRNLKVFQKLFIFVSILLVGGTPCWLCSILHEIGRAPWPLYAISHIFIILSAAVESIVLLIINEQVKTILFSKFFSHQEKLPNARININKNKIGLVVAHENKI